MINANKNRAPHNQPPPPGKGAGKAMWIAAWISLLLLLTLFFGKQEENWNNPNQNPIIADNGKVQEVVLERNRQGHYVLTGKINNTAATFLLDTGATDVVVPGKLADKLGLKRGISGQALTANGLVTVYRTRIERLQIGNIILYDVPASINPSMSMEILLGMSALKQVEFTQRNNTLTLRYQPYQ